MGNTKRRLITSALSILLCFAMLVGSTFAWFTDSVTSSGNVIQSGKLDVEMYYSDTLLGADSSEWKNANGAKVFDYDNWEPGYTDIKYVMVKNAGNLSFKWKLTVEAYGEVTELAEVIDVYYVNPVASTITTLDGLTKEGVLSDVIDNRNATEGVLLPEGASGSSGNVILAIAMHMWDNAGNEYQSLSVGDGFALNLIATQYAYEDDAYGSDYDTDAKWPDTIGPNAITASAAVSAGANSETTAEVTMQDKTGKISATLPAGVLLEKNDTSNVILSVDEIDVSDANITLSKDESSRSVDVHIYGVSKNNTTVMRIGIKELLPVGLNMGNYRFYHVENGATVEMTLLSDGAIPVHNNYEYDAATGDVNLYLKSFSEVALVANNVNPWGGTIADGFAGGDGSEASPYLIANADQLAYFSAAVGGMTSKLEPNDFAGKYVKLIADINIGYDGSENYPVFYPIGYYNSTDSYEKKAGGTVTSNVSSFEGIFDGNGCTVANIYQNTWAMFGDYNDGYSGTPNHYKDGMGLFGYVYNGTVKNLTVKNFSSDGEFTPTGVIAAYSAGNSIFENIAVLDSNPRVYNTGNGGIIGIAGDTSSANTPDNKITLQNITVDQTNVISALWGSWDVACGGLVGMFRGYSKLDMNNCHVAAQIDVNNDVCANYQYYWYRYSGMFIGSVRRNTTDKDGYTVAYTDNITPVDCTYTYGEWNEYWYCELVKNSLASYTHDHQFSRLTKINSLADIQDDSGNWNVEGNFVIPNADNTAAECYHIFKNSNGELYQHFHNVADESNPNIYETFDLDGNGQLDDLKEDRTCYYMPFGQMMNGDGYGVKPTYEFAGFTSANSGESTVKFEDTQKITTYIPGYSITLGELVTSVVDDSKLSKVSIYVSVTSATENDNVSATYRLDKDNWENSVITFAEGSYGTARIIITDYYYCTPTIIMLTLESPSDGDITVTPPEDFEEDDGIWG
ncbi:MAG: SipW-dependent-type signal peptide-containing protein [Clostridia bacterium]|nr:SipW-dependent-type signal peptide-containing protein [Clostridia bacterium]